MRKYQPIYDYLLKYNRNSLDITFSKLEKILGFRLPQSAYQYNAWWSNNSSHSNARAWVAAGWQTEQINLTGQRVRFVKIGGPLKIKKSFKKKVQQVVTDKFHFWDGSEKICYELTMEWKPIGKVMLDNSLKLIFPHVTTSPSLYRIKIKHKNKIAYYIGETDNLKRRFGNYRHPGPSQQTSLRINKYLIDSLKDGAEIGISIVQEVWIKDDGKSLRADLADKAVRRMFENMAIFCGSSQDIESLNR